jgi:transcriptional regulator with GAF, ATPase, and Fis domain
MTIGVSASPVNHPTFRAAQSGLQRIVENLTESPEIALARIWLLQTSDDCEVCRSKLESAESESSLHLAASAGSSRNPSRPESWNRLDGSSHRFPLRSQKIGRIGATGEPLIVRHAAGESSLTNPEWLSREGIQSFFGYPLVQDGGIFGVLAVFSRRELNDADLRFLRQIAEGGARLLADANRLADQDRRLSHLNIELASLRADLDSDGRWETLIASSPASRKWAGQIQLAAQHEQPVLIVGEHGAGKEFTARRIHGMNGRRGHVFHKLHAASLTIESLESIWDRAGTLFLDAIERTPQGVQAKLTEMLLAKPAGSAFRVLASSAVDLRAEVAAGRLRNDLFCALSVAEIDVPTLRDRRDDLPELVGEIVQQICRREHRDPLEIDPAALARLSRHAWPGNVRELRHVLECAVWRAEDGRLALDDCLKIAPDGIERGDAAFVSAEELKRHERANVLACLKQSRWKVYGRGGAAELLGMKPTTLLYRMKSLGIRKPAR